MFKIEAGVKTNQSINQSINKLQTNPARNGSRSRQKQRGGGSLLLSRATSQNRLLPTRLNNDGDGTLLKNEPRAPQKLSRREPTEAKVGGHANALRSRASLARRGPRARTCRGNGRKQWARGRKHQLGGFFFSFFFLFIGNTLLIYDGLKVWSECKKNKH